MKGKTLRISFYITKSLIIWLIKIFRMFFLISILEGKVKIKKYDIINVDC